MQKQTKMHHDQKPNKIEFMVMVSRSSVSSHGHKALGILTADYKTYMLRKMSMDEHGVCLVLPTMFPLPLW